MLSFDERRILQRYYRQLSAKQFKFICVQPDPYLAGLCVILGLEYPDAEPMPKAWGKPTLRVHWHIGRVIETLREKKNNDCNCSCAGFKTEHVMGSHIRYSLSPISGWANSPHKACNCISGAKTAEAKERTRCFAGQIRIQRTAANRSREPDRHCSGFRKRTCCPGQPVAGYNAGTGG